MGGFGAAFILAFGVFVPDDYLIALLFWIILQRYRETRGSLEIQHRLSEELHHRESDYEHIF